jgi:hypothetical protein
MGAFQSEEIAVLTAVLMIAGVVLLLVGCVMLIINAFKVSVLWGLGVIFLVKNWQENKKSFLIQVAGLALVVVGVVLGHPAPTQ